MVKISDLRMLEVINMTNGKRLGTIEDIELDLEKGKVTALIMPGGMKGWMIFKHREEQIIPWDRMVNVGQDVILVELDRNWENSSAIVKKDQNIYLDDDDSF